MSRKERNDVDYFPHPVKHGKKMFYLRSKYKNDGYAVWFMLLEQLGMADYHYLNLSDKIQLMYLSSEFSVSEEVLLEIINILVEFDEFDKTLWYEHKILFNNEFIESVRDAYKKRNNECIDKTSLVDLLINKGILKEPLGIPKDKKGSPKVTEKPQTKLKKKRVEETKEDSSAETSGSDGVYPKCMELYNNFIIARTGVGAKINPATGAAMKKIITYLTSQIKDKEKISTEVPRAFEYVFMHFDRWDAFHKGQLNLNQIESNLVNIINAIRNGKPTTASKPQSKYAPQ